METPLVKKGYPTHSIPVLYKSPLHRMASPTPPKQPISQEEAQRLLEKERAEEAKVPIEEQSRIARIIREAFVMWGKHPPSTFLDALRLGEDKTFLPDSFQSFSKLALALFRQAIDEKTGFQWQSESIPAPKAVALFQNAKTWADVREHYLPYWMFLSIDMLKAGEQYLGVLQRDFSKLFEQVFLKYPRETIMTDLYEKGVMVLAKGMQHRMASIPNVKAEDVGTLLKFINDLNDRMLRGEVDPGDTDEVICRFVDKLTKNEKE